MPDYEEIEAQNLIINEMSKEKYESITPEPLELYLTPDTTDQDIADAVSTHNTSNTAHADIRTIAEKGETAYNTIQNYGNIVTHNTSEFATSTQGSLADTAVQPNDNISELNNDAGYITGITSADVTNALGYTPYNSTNPNNYITNSALTNYVTTNTNQKITAAKAVFGTDVAFGSDQTQKNLFAVVSNNNSQSGVWTGRLTVGAKDRTFILGTYGNKCVLGAHSWTNAQQGTGAAWEDVYINADGDKTVYLGGSPINGRQALFKVTNVNYTTAGKVQINRVTDLLQSNWKDVACWDDDVSKFNNDAGYITSSDVGDATLTIQQNGTTVDTFTANATSDKTINVTVPTDTNELTNGAGFITNSALTNYVTTNTLQTLSSGKKIFANDAVMAGNQTALLATISNSNTTTSDNAWVGRYICGAKNLTFLMGTYRTMAGIGAHTWTNAQTGAGAGWADFYMNPDGDKAVYIGGYGWTKNSGWLKVKNSSNTSGTVQVNKGSISSPSWKDVAYKGENVSDFSFTSISGYSAGSNQMLTHDTSGNLKWVNI